MNDDNNLDLRRLLRTFYEEAELCATDGEREQLITKVVRKIQECRFCAFEKEQTRRSDEIREVVRAGGHLPGWDGMSEFQKN